MRNKTVRDKKLFWQDKGARAPCSVGEYKRPNIKNPTFYMIGLFLGKLKAKGQFQRLSENRSCHKFLLIGPSK